MSESSFENDYISEIGSVKSENPVQDQFLHDLGVAARSSGAAFCCGGRLPIGHESGIEEVKDTLKAHRQKTQPVVIRWDRKDNRSIGKLTLPLSTAEDQQAMEDFVDSCAPATFGKDGKDTLDESYRRASKLDSTQFSTNFSPYELGIIGVIAQTLLPGITGSLARESGGRTFVENLGVVAELYKLNVYSAPSGKFKAHVDTPRGPTQFGSLVVCLPHRHQGGELSIRHGSSVSKEMRFNWNDQEAEIRWAAFYSDCEHEVKEVTAGHRVTLTYNLYAHEQVGGILRHPSPVDTDSFALYRCAKEALANSDFLPTGGILGFHCAHAYAHTNNKVTINLPMALKGVDAVIFASFRKLGIPVDLCAVMEDLYEYDSEDNTLKRDLVSTGLHELQISELGQDEDNEPVEQIVLDAWPSNWQGDIHWLGSPRNQEIAVVHLAYGNEVSQEWHYSTAAILVKVPSTDSEERKVLASG